MFGYNVKINQNQEHYDHDGQEWGEWSASYTNQIDSKVTKTNEYPDVVAPFDIPVGSNALVVWVEWSSGDSFGHGVRSNAEAIGIFLDLNAATELAQQIRQNENSSYLFKTSDGQSFESGFAPWTGWFEKLEEVHIDVVTIW